MSKPAVLKRSKEKKIASQQKRFWMIWREAGGPPTLLHLGLKSVEKETARLAAKHPGIKFYVLEARMAATKIGELLQWETVGPADGQEDKWT